MEEENIEEAGERKPASLNDNIFGYTRLEWMMALGTVALLATGGLIWVQSTGAG